MFYITIENDTIISAGECPCDGEGITSIEVSEEIYNEFVNDRDTYIWNGTEIVRNPNYEEIKEQKRKQTRIAELKEELEELDKKRIRAICEPSIKDETTGETWLDYYNKQIEEIREEINDLEG